MTVPPPFADPSAQRSRNESLGEFSDKSPLLDALSDLTVVIDSQGTVLHANRRLRDLLGQERQDIGAVRLASIYPAHRRTEATRRLTTLLEGWFETCELPLIDASGREIEVEARAVPISWHGRPAWLLIGRDISELERADAVKRETETRYRAVLEAFPYLVFVTDGLGTILDCQSAKSEIQFAEWDNCIGMRFAECLPRKFASAFADHFVMATSRRQKERFEYLVPIDDESRYFDIQIIPYAADRILTIMHDVTHWRRAEEAVLRREAYLSAILDNLPHMVWLKDREGRFQAVNQVFAKAVGRNHSDEITGLTDFDLWPQDVAAERLRVDEIVMSEGTKWINEERVSTEEGDRWFEIFKSPIRDDNGKTIGTTGLARDITQRKRSDEELRRSRQQILTVLDNIDALVYVADIETNELLFTNKKLRDINPDAQPGKTCWEVLQLGQDAPCDFCTNRHLFGPDGQPAPTYTWEHFNARSQTWVQCRDSVIRWLDGRLCRLEIATDITDRKATEECLRHQVQFESLVISLSMRFVYQDSDSLDHEIESALAQVGESTGLDRCGVFLFGPHRIRMSNTVEWCAEGITSWQADWNQVETSTTPWLMERLKARESIHITELSELPPEAFAEREVLRARNVNSATIVPLVTATRLLGFVCYETERAAKEWTDAELRLLRTLSDIFANAFDRRQIVRALRSSEARHRSLLGAIPDLMFRLNRRGEILDFAPGHQRHPNLQRENLLGTQVDAFVDPASLSQLHRSIAEAIEHGRIESADAELDFGTGGEMHEIRLSPSGANEVIAIVRNVNERARLERMRSDFINDASHELRTPLTTIILMVELLECGGDEEEVSEYWRVLKAELDRAQLLIEDLLTIGRLESGKLDVNAQPLDVTEVIAQSVKNVRPMAANHDIGVDMTFAPGELPLVMGNTNSLRQVFVNLLNNAVKFSVVKGQVTISGKVEGSSLLIEVADTGIGIPEEELDQLFSRFFRASNALEKDIQGTGMGLYIIRAIVEALGGSIHVRSKVNQGTTFTVRLRLAD